MGDAAARTVAVSRRPDAARYSHAPGPLRSRARHLACADARPPGAPRSHSRALIITPRSHRALAAVVLGVLLAGPLPEAGAFLPTPAELVPAVAFAGSPSCCAPAAARAPRGGWSVAAPSAAGVAARRVGRKSTEMRCDSGNGREPAKDGQELAGVWTEEITGDEKFDTAWMAAWQNKDRIPCPFFKRRATDVLEATLAVGRFVLARHKSLLVFAPRSSKGGAKVIGLAPQAVLEVIRSDFEDRRYYITGQLTREVYSDVSFVSVSLSVASGPELAAACGANPAPRISAGTPERLHAREASAVCHAVLGSRCARPVLLRVRRCRCGGLTEEHAGAGMLFRRARPRHAGDRAGKVHQCHLQPF